MPVGAANTAQFTTGVMLDFDPMIDLLDPWDIPLQSIIPTSPATAIKVEWQDDTLLLPNGTAAGTSTTGDAFITVATGTQINWQTNDVVLNKNSGEYFRVTGYSATTADILLISRGYASSTAATISSGHVLIGIGVAGVEGADPEAARQADRTARYNVTQVLGPYKVQVTKTERSVSKYGVADEFDYQVSKWFKQANVVWEQSLIYGTRLNDTTSTAPRRLAGGLKYYITTNTDTTTTTLTQAAIRTQLQAIFAAGGNPNTIMVGGTQKGKIGAFTDGGVIQVAQQANTRGVVVDSYVSDFGTQRIMLNRYMQTGDLAIFNTNQLRQRVLRPLHYEDLAKTGDSDNGMLVGEKTLMVRAQRHAAWFSALT